MFVRHTFNGNAGAQQPTYDAGGGNNFCGPMVLTTTIRTVNETSTRDASGAVPHLRVSWTRAREQCPSTGWEKMSPDSSEWDFTVETDAGYAYYLRHGSVVKWVGGQGEWDVEALFTCPTTDCYRPQFYAVTRVFNIEAPGALIAEPLVQLISGALNLDADPINPHVIAVATGALLSGRGRFRSGLEI